MQLHPRFQIVQEASRKFSNFLLELQKEHELTSAELTRMLSEQISSQMKYCIRAERHPNNPDKPGDSL